MEVLEISLKHYKTYLEGKLYLYLFTASKKANSNLNRSASQFESANFSTNSKIESSLLCVDINIFKGPISCEYITPKCNQKDGLVKVSALFRRFCMDVYKCLKS